jgi:hypothetical protein
MAVSRRRFLRVGTAAGFWAVIPLRRIASAFGQQSVADEGLFKVPIESQTDQLNSWTEETFLPFVNTRFRIYASPLRATNLKLIKVGRREPASTEKSAKTAKLDCFWVLFRGPRSRPLEAGTYKVEHDQMGSFDLFISPVNDHNTDRLYQAVFSRLQQ